jgi:hypothetical protein
MPTKQVVSGPPVPVTTSDNILTKAVTSHLAAQANAPVPFLLLEEMHSKELPKTITVNFSSTEQNKAFHDSTSYVFVTVAKGKAVSVCVCVCVVR